MKGVVIFLIMILCSAGIHAQIPAGGDFEEWTSRTGPFSTWSDPLGWTSPNFFSSLNGFASVSVTSDAAIGDSAAMLKTFPLGLAGVPFLAYLVNGTARVDSFDGTVEVISGGEPDTEKHGYIRGWYKFTAIELFDSAVVEVIQKKWNGSSADTLAYVREKLGPVADWTFFQFQIDDWTPAETPDTTVIAIFSSNPESPKEGGELWLDGISMSDVLGIEQDNIEMEKAFIYPNPASQILNLRFSQPAMINMWDQNGRLMRSEQWNGNPIYIAELPAGFYFLEVLTENQPSEWIKWVKI